MEDYGALTAPAPPIADIEIISPAHRRPMLRLSGLPWLRNDGRPESQLFNDGRVFARLHYDEDAAWQNIHDLAYRVWKVDVREFSLSFRYNRFSIDDVTAESWVSRPDRFEFTTDCEHNDPFARGDPLYGRRARIYAFFNPRSVRLDRPPEVDGGKYETGRVWWLSCWWNTTPPEYVPHSSPAFDGADSEWVRTTGAEPPWLAAHTLPPLSGVWPRSDQRLDPRAKSRLTELPGEIQQMIYGHLFHFKPSTRPAGNRELMRSCQYFRQTPAILLVCRCINEWALPALFRTPLEILEGVHPRHFRYAKALKHLISPVLMRNLRTIRIRLASMPPGPPSNVIAIEASPFLEGYVRILRAAVEVIDLWIDGAEEMDDEARRKMGLKKLTIDADAETALPHPGALPLEIPMLCLDVVESCDKLKGLLGDKIELEVGDPVRAASAVAAAWRTRRGRGARS